MLNRGNPLSQRAAVMHKAVYPEGQKGYMHRGGKMLAMEMGVVQQPSLLSTKLVGYRRLWKKTKQGLKKTSKEANSKYFNSSDKHYVIWRIL